MKTTRQRANHRECRVKDVEKKLGSHRDAIRDHIEKSERYSQDYERENALKTVRRIQQEIADLKRRNKTASSSWEDDWRPSRS